MFVLGKFLCFFFIAEDGIRDGFTFFYAVIYPFGLIRVALLACAGNDEKAHDG